MTQVKTRESTAAVYRYDRGDAVLTKVNPRERWQPEIGQPVYTRDTVISHVQSF